jgi:modulator of FtsH protease
MNAPVDWQGFAEVTGAASGALTGLLFVAVSLNASRIAGHRGLRASAAQTLLMFLLPLGMAMALLAPGQARWALGGELVATGVGASLVLISLANIKHALGDDDRKLISIFNRKSASFCVMLMFVASGIAVACGADSGLYLLLPASFVAFISGVLNAWYFLLPPPPPQTRPDRRREEREEEAEG